MSAPRPRRPNRSNVGLPPSTGGRTDVRRAGSRDRLGGTVALFSFPSLADYERYRERFGVDPDFVEADRIREETRCVRRYERSFMRPLFGGD
jgi:NIPSNAP